MGAWKNRLILLAMMLALPLAGLVFFGILSEHNFRTLPYYTREGAVEGRSLEAQRVGQFNLTNQDGEAFSSQALRGKVWMAAFFGTDAPHVAQVTRQLLWPNFRYRDEEDIVLVCFSLSPKHDTPEVLKAYVDRNTRYNGPRGKWQFLTGSEDQIDRIVSEDFMIQRDLSEPNNVATLWLVDAEGFLRGVYHAASEDAIRDAVEDIALLQKEMDLAAYAHKQLAEEVAGRPDLPVLGPEGHTVPAFAFVGLDSVEVSHRTVAGRVKIVDYFFTHCPSICPIMSSQLARSQAWMRDRNLQDSIMILSHSVDPERDTPERLLWYAQRMGADTTQWKFMTGDKETLYDQARHGYYLTALESDTAAGGFFHSDTFVLVDRENRIRGLYDGTSTAEVDAMLLDAAQLVFED
ncbi:MAG: SCO family protein [Bacteroidetes bacterium]|nr:SCO family protein [Bacteroidota bacterium]MDA0904138.1 SCO family protein [Bacteroidota bacterium]MDA1242662.1 SCO family protein [Bacteroidota bacterium]